MYEYIKGEITEISPSHVILENSGIGYLINISVNTFEAVNNKPQAKLFIHQILREDTNTLYGFAGSEERETFRLLISVSGIGANTARLILSSLKTQDVAKAVSDGDVAVFKGIKGIGVKTAQRLIVDLKDKISNLSSDSSLPLSVSNRTVEEAIQALVMLGFNKKNTQKTVHDIFKKNNSLSIEELVKLSIKTMSKN